VSASRVIFLEWEDSSHGGETGWQDVGTWSKYKPIRCFSVGRIMFEDDEQIVLSSHWYDSGDDLRAQGSMRIPKSAVKRRLNLMINGKRQRRAA
jgi:hypothetical protein